MKTPIYNAFKKMVERDDETMTWSREQAQAMVAELDELKASHKTLASKASKMSATENTFAELRQALATAETVAHNLREREQARRVADVAALARDTLAAGDEVLSAAAVLALVDDH